MARQYFRESLDLAENLLGKQHPTYQIIFNNLYKLDNNIYLSQWFCKIFEQTKIYIYLLCFIDYFFKINIKLKFY